MADASCARRIRQNLDKFAALIATPGVLSTGVALPANGDLYASSASAIATPTSILTANTTRSIGIGPQPQDPSPSSLAANTVRHIGWYERATVIAKNISYAPAVKLYVRDGLGNLFLIAQ